MPGSVIVAMIALVVDLGASSVMILIAFLARTLTPPGAVQWLVSVGLGLLILLGFLFGHRLAWQWGRICTMLGGLFLGFALAALLMTLGDERRTAVPSAQLLVAAGLLFAQVLPLFVIFFALGTDSAREWFRLICPKCGTTTSKSADFLFSQARCGSCDNVW